MRLYIGIVLALLLVMSSLMFAWHMELVTVFNNNVLTNGFGSYDGVKVYHVFMYVMFAMDFISAAYIIKSSIPANNLDR